MTYIFVLLLNENFYFICLQEAQGRPLEAVHSTVWVPMQGRLCQDALYKPADPIEPPGPQGAKEWE